MSFGGRSESLASVPAVSHGRNASSCGFRRGPRSAAVGLLAGLEGGDIARVHRVSETLIVPAGARILAAGDAPSGIYLVESGRADVLLGTHGGREERIDEVGPGAILGEIALLTGAPASATVRARDEVRVRLLRPDVFAQLSAELPRLVENLAATLAARLADGDHRPSPRRFDHLIGVGRGAPRTALEGLAAAIAWVGNERVALVADTAVSPEQWLPRAVGPGVDVVQPTDLQWALDRYRHVVTPVSIDQHLAHTCDRLIVVGGRDDVRTGRADAIRMECPELTAAERVAIAAGVLRPATPAGRMLAAVARKVLGRQVGVAFGAGAARGWAHIGVIRAFERHDIPLDYIAGTSVGALVAALSAFGRTPDEIAEFMDRAGSKLCRPHIGRGGVLSSRHFAGGLQQMFGETRVENLDVPLGITATDVSRGCEVVLREGRLRELVLASCAIPGLYPPQRVGDRILVDGGLLNPVPSNVALDLGADIVVGVKLNQARPPTAAPTRIPGTVELITTAFQLMQGKIASEAASGARVLIEPTLCDRRGYGLRKFGEGRRFIEAGEAAVEEALPRLAAALPWVGRTSA
jgi:NTE family protein